MKRSCSILQSLGSRWLLLIGLLILPQVARAQWMAAVGAENRSMGHQALAFLPNEIWIHAGDNVTWTFNSSEIHTVTFLNLAQVRLPFDAGCPGFASGESGSFEGSTCLSTAPLTKGQKFTVAFPAIGNFKLVCLVHQNMTGVIHVLSVGERLPHWQDFYDDEAAQQLKALLSDDDLDREQTQIPGEHDDRNTNSVSAGMGEVTANGGGSRTFSVMRFMDAAKTIHVGDTVEWTNLDPATPHTITFGVEPMNPVFPVNAILDTDGALHGTISVAADSVHSGLVLAAPQDQMFLPTPALSVTRFRVTFTHAGVFPYICALHDGLDMKGKITVLP